MPHEWKVGELAKLTGLTIRTLRYYDQIGLFSPSGRTEAGYRLYTDHDLTRLQQIMSLKELGLSLEQIKSVLAGSAISLYDIVSMQAERLRENIRTPKRKPSNFASAGTKSIADALLAALSLLTMPAIRTLCRIPASSTPIPWTCSIRAFPFP